MIHGVHVPLQDSARFPLPPGGSLRRGFTALELLVALVILAILSLFVFAGARHIAGGSASVTCMHQLRQLASAGLAWAHDHQGRLPDMGGWYSRTKGDPLSLFSYLGLPDSGLPVEWDGVYTCPVFQKHYPTSASPHRTYAINRYAAGSRVKEKDDWEKVLQSAPPELLSRVVAPGRMAFFMDGRPHTLAPAPDYAYRAYAAPDSIGAEATPHLHGGGLNVAFLDGHAACLPTVWIEREQLRVTANRVHPFWGAGK